MVKDIYRKISESGVEEFKLRYKETAVINWLNNISSKGTRDKYTRHLMGT